MDGCVEAWREKIEQLTGFSPLAFKKRGDYWLVFFDAGSVAEMARVVFEELKLGGKALLESMMFFVVPESYAGEQGGGNLVLEVNTTVFSYTKNVVFIRFSLGDGFYFVVKLEAFLSLRQQKDSPWAVDSSLGDALHDDYSIV